MRFSKWLCIFEFVVLVLSAPDLNLQVDRHVQ